MRTVDRERSRLTVPIAALLTLGFGLPMLIAVVVEVRVGLDTARENTEELLRDKAHAAIDRVAARIRATLEPVEERGRAIATRVARGDLAVGSPEFDAFLLAAAATAPNLEEIAVVFADRAARRYRSDSSSAVTIPAPLGDRDLARAPGAPAAPTWGAPRAVGGKMATVLRTPLRDHAGKLVALLDQAVSVATLSRQVARASPERDRYTPFVLYGDDAVLAHPLLIAGNLALELPDERLPTAAEIGDGYLAGIRSPNEIPTRLIEFAPYPGDTVKGVEFGAHPVIFVYRQLTGYGPLPLTVGVHVDGSETRVQLHRVAIVGAGGTAIVIVFALVAVLFSRAAARPARRLARAAEVVRSGRLDAVEPIRPSLIRELDDASASFNEMVAGLRERDIVRNLFGKFVPETVAASMLRSPEGLQPQSCEATILFVDLAGFTALTERLGPNEVVEVLNAYFGVLVDVIEEHQGVVTQFQGDAVLAVFNVPVPVADHAGRAVAAARAIRERVAGREFRGERLECRIGVNTGEVVAGNVGASDRMSYTVHGDAVNLAARLEQLNKEYGTGILIAETTVRAAGDAGFRRVDSVAIRGHSIAIIVYTI